MARFDGTGPIGMGSMTGKGMGYCAEDASETPLYGRSFRRGGFGRGGQSSTRRATRCGFRRYSLDDIQSNEEALLEEKKILEKRLNFIEQKLKNSNDK